MKFVQIVSKVDSIFFTIATVFLSVGCGLAVINALLRKLFNMGFPWAEEMSTYLVVMMLFLAIPHLERLDRHLCIGILMAKLKTERMKKFYRIIRGVWTIVVMCILFRFGIILAQTMATNNVVTNILRWPRAPFFSVMLIAFIMIILIYIIVVVARKGGQYDDNNA